MHPAQQRVDVDEGDRARPINNGVCGGLETGNPARPLAVEDMAVGERAQRTAQRPGGVHRAGQHGMPPWRSTSRSSIESAPVTMPAAIVATLPGALDHQ
jgi:hypothetical protein